ncbi:MAG: hypothetical protein DMG30_12835 [Acidobacteria bacterium]|nr:MAG: hypothetical protein DMG30_12835 [Acidobacteriota bacterium]
MVERREVLKDDIARRAYEIYVQRGEENGKDVEDWLRAEKEISGKPADVPKSKTVAAVR